MRPILYIYNILYTHIVSDTLSMFATKSGLHKSLYTNKLSHVTSNNQYYVKYNACLSNVFTVLALIIPIIYNHRHYRHYRQIFNGLYSLYGLCCSAECL